MRIDSMKPPLTLAAAVLASLFAACSAGGDPQVDALALEARKAKPPVLLQTPLDPTAIPKFVNQLPLPATSASDAYPGGLHTIVAGASRITLRMCEFQSQILPPPMPPTVVWGYVVGRCPNGLEKAPRDSYLGPIIAAARGTPTEVAFVNELGTTDTTKVLAWKYGTDQTLHWADPLTSDASGNPIGEQNACAHHGHEMMPGQLPMDLGPTGPDCAANYKGPIPAVPHLHGGEVPSFIDGGPDAWFTSDGRHHGSGYYTADATAGANAAVYRYPNEQEPAPLWFHDHTLGATRLNVYAGLAGGYLLNDGETAVPNLPDVTPLVIQDRMFDSNGQLLFQSGFNGGTLWALNPDHPFWNPEFLGDTIVVNGKAWPNLTVEPRRYRFLVLNGSNARTYELSLRTEGVDAGPGLWVVANDGGLLDAPALAHPHLVSMPGERYEVIVDFGGLAAGTKIVMKNTAAAPYPFGDPVEATPTVAEIVQFTVGPCTSGKCGLDDASFDPTDAVSPRAIPMVRLAAGGTTAAGVVPTLVRQLTLNEVMAMDPTSFVTDVYTGSSYKPGTAALGVDYEAGPLEVLLNNTEWFRETTETPVEGTTEIWEIVNLTADAHPIHLHLVQFQILNRQAFAGEEESAETGSPTGYFAAYFDAFASGTFEPAMGPPLGYANNGVKAVPGYGSGPTPPTLPYVGGNPDVTPYLVGAPLPPEAWESGWKDTAFVPPGHVTRYMVRWAPTDQPVAAPPALLAYPFDPSVGPGYVWHCHIIDHEDNEMMRRTAVTASAAAGVVRTFP